jgi:hypothetical protein
VEMDEDAPDPVRSPHAVSVQRPRATATLKSNRRPITRSPWALDRPWADAKLYRRNVKASIVGASLKTPPLHVTSLSEPSIRWATALRWVRFC